jgi:hypothetical protein
MMAMVTSITIIATTFLDNKNNKNIGRKRGGEGGNKRPLMIKIRAFLLCF